MKNKKGFTLIELLAVIVLLAIIALIITPVISNIIEMTKRNSFVDSTYGVIDSAKNYYTEHLTNLVNDVKFNCTNENCISDSGDKLQYNGTLNGSGSLILFKDGNIALCTQTDKLTAIKNVSDSKLTITDNTSCKFDEETNEYGVEKSASIVELNACQNDLANNKELITSTIDELGVSSSSVDNWDDVVQKIKNLADNKYNQGVEFADGRVNNFSASYVQGYTDGQKFANENVSESSASYSTGYSDGVNSVEKIAPSSTITRFSTSFEATIGKYYAIYVESTSSGVSANGCTIISRNSNMTFTVSSSTGKTWFSAMMIVKATSSTISLTNYGEIGSPFFTQLN